MTADDAGDISVVADTLFGTAGKMGSEIGPKIFLVPITIADFEQDNRMHLPHMGFSFAGNTLSGQFAHALASTCLQNLGAPQLGNAPEVEDVARFYANCSIKIFEEFRRHHAVDSYQFDGVVFGFSPKRGHATAFQFNARVAADGTVEAPVAELELEVGVPHAIGSGASAARKGIAYLRSRQIEINPFSLMYHIIADDSVPSVGGAFQAATANKDGVELCPIVHFVPKLSGGMEVDFSVMGINLHVLGKVAGYVPVGSPQIAQQGKDLEYVAQCLMIDETIRDLEARWPEGDIQ